VSQAAEILYDGFDYAEGSNLGGQGGWANVNTGDEVIVGGSSLSVAGLKASTGRSVSFSEGGTDPQRTYTAVNSGSVFYSFAMQVTALGSLDMTTGGYFIGLGSSSTNFSSTVWTRATAGGGFNIGFQNNTATTGIQWSGEFALNATLFIVGSFNIDTDVADLWINPSSNTFGAISAPSVTFSVAAGTTRTSLDRIFLRQDSTTETPSLIVDELRVGTSWADVTPSSVPEASSFAFVAGLAGVCAVGLRRRSRR
jgi:hypothetical protein